MPYTPDGSKPYYLRLRICLLEGFGDKYKGIYKTIDALSTTTLEDLHQEIFTLFERYDPHLWEFQFATRRPFGRSGVHIDSNGNVESWTVWLDLDEDQHPLDLTLADLSLGPRQYFFYIFDFGDLWIHKISVSSYQEVKEANPAPFRLVKSVGEVPPQYPDFEDEDEE